MQKIVKVSELKDVLNALPIDKDIHIVTGEEWLPEQLVTTSLVDDMLFMQFDNAPEDTQCEEGRGFVQHEVELIRSRFEQIITEPIDAKSKADAILALFLIGHEQSSAEVIEILESVEFER
ncbi:hypothetical protein [Vibrio renipiscarius]|uniref:Uncharacterized protein n=1 Tax=Vibrio renipiscarius TaxID=1461322 RepID=A0A0C2P2Z4_9VIBR|nr:hypothetical protein [Vibrio renipiscarius]KII79560.1 hypothetical protein PL18_07835 [Vibrio renipiscarius]KII80812.1 hypothetical protein OJ16_05830 [Vibrio renipiscarius]